VSWKRFGQTMLTRFSSSRARRIKQSVETKLSREMNSRLHPILSEPVSGSSPVYCADCRNGISVFFESLTMVGVEKQAQRHGWETTRRFAVSRHRLAESIKAESSDIGSENNSGRYTR
jgi:hypothetical protein